MPLIINFHLSTTWGFTLTTKLEGLDFFSFLRVACKLSKKAKDEMFKEHNKKGRMKLIIVKRDLMRKFQNCSSVVCVFWFMNTWLSG